MALCLKHQYLPASLNYQSPNPAVAWDDIPVRIASEAGPWPEHTGPAIAGVSAFGITGTNAHLVLEEPPRSDHPSQAVSGHMPAYLLPLSARSTKALRALVEAYQQKFKETDAPDLYNLCYSAAVRRNHHLARTTFVCQSVGDLADQMDIFLQEQPLEGEVVEEESPRKVLFIFPGQGSQWAGMARQLMQTQPVFRAALERCSQVIQPHTGWSLIEIFNGSQVADYLEQIDFVQPALFAMQVSLAAQWRAWGIEPDAIVGHSMGEVAAAHVAGVISLEDAARVICYRSQLMKTVSGKGAMAVVNLTIAQAQAALAGFEDQLSIAVSNSPQSTVISGDVAALDVLTASLQSQDILTRRVKVDVAAHSPHMEPLRPQLEAALAGLEPRPASVPIFSTVTGQIQDGLSFDIAYWGRNLRQPVLFSSIIEQAIEQGYNTFIELSPHPVLLAAVEQSFPSGDHGLRYAALPSLRRNEGENEAILQSLGQLYQQGYSVDWKKVYPSGGQIVSLPAYPWQREHFWLEIEPPSGSRQALKPGSHPLSGYPVETAALQGTIIRQIRIDHKTFPELYAHRLYASTLLGASAFLELARAAADDVMGADWLVLKDVHFERALILSEEQPTELQIQLDPLGPNAYRFQIFSRDSQGWVRHAEGSVGKEAEPSHAAIDPDRAASSCPLELDSTAFYQSLKNRQIHYDAPLQLIQTARRGTGEAWAVLKEEDAPRLLALDPLFQLPLAALPEAQPDSSPEIFIPVLVDSVVIFSAAQPAHQVYTQVSDSSQLTQNVTMLDAEGRVVAELRGIHFQPFGQSAVQEPKDFLYKLKWQPVEAPAPLSNAPRSGNWLILADEGGMGSALADLLTQAGRRCEVLPSSRMDQMEDWIREQATRLNSSLEGILHLWSLDIPCDHSQHPMRAFEEAQKLSAVSALELVKQVATESWKSAPKLWFVTQADFSAGGPGLPPSDQAPLWGLGRVIAEEHSNLWGGLIHLNAALSHEEAALRLSAELLQPTETQLALDIQQRYALRVVRSTEDEEAYQGKSGQGFHLRPDSAYLITGGIGGIGVEVARWMVEQGARRLVLMGRTPLPDRKDWLGVDPESEMGRRVAAVRALEALGAAVHVAAVDVADEEQLRAYLQTYQQEGWPAIRGVMHAAGVVRDRLVIHTSAEDWQAVLRPKVRGAWLLHEMLPDLDFFVLFSSIGSVMGLVGQGSYAAANAFLDSFVSTRRAMGLPGVSINWGFWKETGMQKMAGAQVTLQSYEKRGFYSIRPSEGIKSAGDYPEKGYASNDCDAGQLGEVPRWFIHNSTKSFRRPAVRKTNLLNYVGGSKRGRIIRYPCRDPGAAARSAPGIPGRLFATIDRAGVEALSCADYPFQAVRRFGP